MQPYQSLCIKKHLTRGIQESINIQSIPSFKNGDLVISIQDFNFRCSQKLNSFQDKLSFCFNYIINFLPFVHFVYCVPYVPTDLCVSKESTKSESQPQVHSQTNQELLDDSNELVKSYLLPFLNAIHQIVPFKNVIIESLDNLNIAHYDDNLKQIVLTDIQKLLDKVKRSQSSKKHIDYDDEEDDELITLLHPVFRKLLNGDLDTMQRLLFLDESVIIINDYYSYFENNYESCVSHIAGFNPSVTKEKFSILFDMLSQSSQVQFNQKPLWDLLGVKTTRSEQHLLDLYALTDISYFNPKRNKENLDYLLESISSMIVIYLIAKNKIDFHHYVHNDHIQKTLVQLAKDMFGEDAVSQNVIDFVMNQTSKSETWIDNKNQQVNNNMDKFKNNHSIPRLSDIHCIEFLDYFDKKLIEKVNKQKLLAEKNKNLPLYKYHSDFDKQLALLDIDENTVSLTKEQRDLPIVQTWFEKAMLIKNQFDMTVIFDFLIWDKMKSIKHPVDLKAWLDEFEYELYLS